LSDSLKHNVLFVFISNFIPSILTYVFWLIASNLTTSAMVGVVGSISSLAMILVAISSLDIPGGAKRFFGKTFSEQQYSEFGVFSSSSVVFILISSIVVLAITLNPWIGIMETIGIETKFVLIIVVIVIGNNLQNMFRSILTSSLKSKSILIPSLGSSSIRLISLILFFIIFGLTEIEVAWAYSIFYLGLAIGLFLVSKNNFYKFSFNEFKAHIKLVIQASIPKWGPSIIGVVGTHLSILVIFSTKGASESGEFFIPYAIFAIIVMLSGSINQISHPVWSGMKSELEQVKLLEKNLKFTFLATLPIAAIIILLSSEIALFFGEDFKNSGVILTVLMLSYPLLITQQGAFFLLHARGHYREVLYIGIIANVPRVILYFVLIPELGSIGGAYAMIIGTILQFFAAAIISKKLGIQIHYVDYAIISIVSYGIGLLMYVLELEIIGATIVFVGSYVIFIKLKLLDKEIIKEICRFIFSEERGENISEKIISKFEKIKLL